MNSRPSSSRTLSIVALAASATIALAIDPQWLELKALQDQIRENAHALRENAALLALFGERIPTGKNAELDAARTKRDAADQALKNVEETLVGEKRKGLQAAQKARDDAVDALYSEYPWYGKKLDDIARLTAEVEKTEANKKELSLSELKALRQAKRELGSLGGEIYELRRIWWERDPAKPLYEKAKVLYEAFGREKGRKEIRDAEGKAKEARRELQAVAEKAALETKVGKGIEEENTKLDAQQKELRAKIPAMEEQVTGGKWTAHTVKTPSPYKDKDGKQREMTTTISIPPGCEKVRGLFVGYWGSLIGDTFVRAGCRKVGMAIVRFEGFDGLFNYTNNVPQCMDVALEKVGQISKHPEIRYAPFLSGGMSTTVIGARNMAYWQAVRAIGVIHVAGGNMHQHRPDPSRTLAGVPFFAANGEFEVFGPEGGIRPEYGRQTQWIMMREQMYRMMAKDRNHLMFLMVQPGGDHGGWDRDLSILAGLFVIKATERRVPTDAPTDKPVKCMRIPPEDGWLIDSDIYTPQFEPAPYKDYKGDKQKAFWVFDEEMARAVTAYHKDKFFMPDLSKKYPVPSDWPPAPR